MPHHKPSDGQSSQDSPSGGVVRVVRVWRIIIGAGSGQVHALQGLNVALVVDPKLARGQQICEDRHLQVAIGLVAPVLGVQQVVYRVGLVDGVDPFRRRLNTGYSLFGVLDAPGLDLEVEEGRIDAAHRPTHLDGDVVASFVVRASSPLEVDLGLANIEALDLPIERQPEGDAGREIRLSWLEVDPSPSIVT